MRLDQVFPAAAGVDVEISGLAYDNRLAGSGTLFFCVPGFTRDGHEFAADAVARGAVALVVESDAPDAPSVLDQVSDDSGPVDVSADGSGDIDPPAAPSEPHAMP